MSENLWWKCSVHLTCCFLVGTFRIVLKPVRRIQLCTVSHRHHTTHGMACTGRNHLQPRFTHTFYNTQKKFKVSERTWNLNEICWFHSPVYIFFARLALLLLFQYLHLLSSHRMQGYMWNVYRVSSGSSLPAPNWTLFSFGRIHMCRHRRRRRHRHWRIFPTPDCSTQYVMPSSHVIGSFCQAARVELTWDWLKCVRFWCWTCEWLSCDTKSLPVI